jgi:hypothetical protein
MTESDRRIWEMAFAAAFIQLRHHMPHDDAVVGEQAAELANRAVEQARLWKHKIV